MDPVRLMVVDDDKLQRWSLKEKLSASGQFEVSLFENAEKALQELSPERVDLVLLDIRLPGMSGLEALKEIHTIDRDLPVVMITADDQTATVVECMRNGATDYVCKPFEFEELLIVLQKAWEEAKLRREVIRLRREQESQHLVSIVGASAQMRALREEVARVSRSDASTILLQGENGTGKDLVAKVIHRCSRRYDHPFVAVNCAALPETLIESELFGHERGAFTDAKIARKGVFELAEGGTLLLDEIGDMPPLMQPRLLRVIEEKCFRRLGGAQDVRTNLRLIASTNKNLERAVSEGRFRRDLLYRLKVIPISIPPLREHKEDIPLLVEYFIAGFNSEFHRNVQGLAEEALRLLMAYAWPGNVRELRNVIERAIILGTDDAIAADRLPAELKGGEPSPDREISGLFKLPATGISLQEVEKAFVQQALALSGNNQSQAARLLGLERDALRRRMEKHSLE